MAVRNLEHFGEGVFCKERDENGAFFTLKELELQLVSKEDIVKSFEPTFVSQTFLENKNVLSGSGFIEYVVDAELSSIKFDYHLLGCARP